MKKLSHFLGTAQGKFIGLIVLLIAVLFAYYFYAMSNREDAAPGTITISDTDHVRGNESGTVTLVEFGDLQCPACAAYEPIIKQVIEDNSDVLKFVFRHFPLTQIHKNALLSAKASEAAGLQGKFWEMHDVLYEKQAEWSGVLNARDIFLTYATTLGLDTQKFLQDLDNEDIEKKVLAEYREGISLGVTGTPTFFINGERIQSPRSVEEFNAVIRAAAGE